MKRTDVKRPAPTRPTVMVADDFDDTRLLLRLWFERMGYGVVEAEDGLRAVEVALREMPDLIIMDLHMPVLDGLEATRLIRDIERLRGVPVVAVSAYGAEQFRGAALSAGCSEYVATPFDPAELKSLIERLLKEARRDDNRHPPDAGRALNSTL